MKKKRIIPVIVILALAAMGTWLLYKKNNAPFYYAGTLEATTIDVPARLPTVVATVSAKESDNVSKEQLLVNLDCDELKIQAALAMKNFERAERLLKIGSMPRDTFDQVQGRKDETELKLSWCDIKSPISGRVVQRYREPGEWVAPGIKLLSIANLEDIWAYVYVPEPMLSKLKLGMSISGFLPEMSMRVIPGIIIRINEEAEFTPKNVQTREERTRLVFGIKIKFTNSEGLLKPGMPIEVELPETPHD